MIQNQKETIKYQARLHWIIYLWPLVLFGLGYYIDQYRFYAGPVGIALMGVAAILEILNCLTYLTSFLYVSDAAVVFKSGILVKYTNEIPFHKIESIDVRQSIVGSILGYGAIVVIGTGGSRNGLNFVSHPLIVRRFLEQAISPK